MSGESLSASNAKSASELLIQSSITIGMIFTALMLGDFIHPWGTKVSLSILEKGAEVPTIFSISGIWLVLGAVSMSYLLFGWRVFLAVFIGFHVSALYLYGWSLNPFALTDAGNLKTFAWTNHAHALVTTFGPLAAIYVMRSFKLSKFFEGEKLVFQHVIFLIIFTAFVNTYAKFFVDTSLRTWLGLSIHIDELTYVQSMLIGDITGGIVFVFILALVVVPVIRMVAPTVITET